jgi:hypothetical protein
MHSSAFPERAHTHTHTRALSLPPAHPPTLTQIQWYHPTPHTRAHAHTHPCRVIVRNFDLGLNADALITAIHDYTARTLEEMFIRGPLPNSSNDPDTQPQVRECVREGRVGRGEGCAPT